MHIHGSLSKERSSQGIWFYRQAKGILFLNSACHGLHSPLGIDNWRWEETPHTQKASKDQYIGHECHLVREEKRLLLAQHNAYKITFETPVLEHQKVVKSKSLSPHLFAIYYLKYALKQTSASGGQK